MVMTKYADVVVGPETGLMVAAGCFDTPKIMMLSHSSEENLTKYWKNCTALSAGVECQPCHQLHYTRDSCPLDVRMGHPICMGELQPVELYDALELEYNKWKEKRA